MGQASDSGFDRRDAVRRRVYLACLCAGIPTVAATWLARGSADPFIFATYPPFAALLVALTLALWTRRLSVRAAERIVLATNVAVFMSALAVGVLGAADLDAVRQEMTVSSLLTMNLMVLLAYLAFETRQALRISLAVFAAFAGIIAVRVIPELLAGRDGAEAVDYLRAIVFLGANVGLLYGLAQVKEQVAEARSAAAAMTTLAYTDSLTGLPNRRRLHEALQERVAETDRYGYSLAVVLLDVDRFKRINDTHGHDAGDEVLQEVADVLRGTVRAVDILGRWGGEEFVIVAPHTERAQAAELAERCRATLAATTFRTVGTVTASLGVALHTDGDSAWQLLRRADDALYAAKDAGRNRVHCEVSVAPARNDGRDGVADHTGGADLSVWPAPGIASKLPA